MRRDVIVDVASRDPRRFDPLDAAGLRADERCWTASHDLPGGIGARSDAVRSAAPTAWRLLARRRSPDEPREPRRPCRLADHCQATGGFE